MIVWTLFMFSVSIGKKGSLRSPNKLPSRVRGFSIPGIDHHKIAPLQHSQSVPPLQAVESPLSDTSVDPLASHGIASTVSMSSLAKRARRHPTLQPNSISVESDTDQVDSGEADLKTPLVANFPLSPA